MMTAGAKRRKLDGLQRNTQSYKTASANDVLQKLFRPSRGIWTFRHEHKVKQTHNLITYAAPTP
jgi:hypothetical protein